MLLEELDTLSMGCQLRVERLFLLVIKLTGLLRVCEILGLKFFNLFLLFLQFSLCGFAPLSLLLICLFVFEDLTLRFIDDLKEEVFHQAHRFLIFFGGVELDEFVVANTYSFQLLLESLRILQNILDLGKARLCSRRLCHV